MIDNKEKQPIDSLCKVEFRELFSNDKGISAVINNKITCFLQCINGY